MMSAQHRLVALALFVLVTLAGAGCSSGGDDNLATTVSSNEEAKAAAKDPASTTTTSAGASEAPSSAVVAGSGPEVGASARLFFLASASLGADMSDKAGVNVGTTSGACTQVDPGPERAGLTKAVVASSPESKGLTLANDADLLVARCGEESRALVKWGSLQTTLSMDEFMRTKDGAWGVVKQEAYAGCALSADLNALWRFGDKACGDA